MTNLLVESHKPDQDGQTLAISPEYAGWDYVGFQVYQLKEGQSVQKETEDQEVCIVLLGGKANMTTNEESFKNIGDRMNVFEKKSPYSVYVPDHDTYKVEALTELEIAICLAPGKGSHKARLIAPDDVGVEDRGSGDMSRHVHNILPETEPADSLLVVEVYTPEGNYSSFPPHKHDTVNPPDETYLEESYYHKITPNSGFLFHRVYTDDGSLDEAMAVKNNQAVMVPKGYHPVSTPPGHECYYLNVMAGPERAWKFHNDENFTWLFERM